MSYQFRVWFEPAPPYGSYVVRFWDPESKRLREQWKRRRAAAAAAGEPFEERPPQLADKRVMVPAEYWKACGHGVPRTPSDRALHLAIEWAAKRRDELARGATIQREPRAASPSPAIQAAAARGGEFDLETTIRWYIERNPNAGEAATIAKYRDCGNRLVAYFGAARLLSTITRVDAEAYRNAHERRLRNRTILGDLVFLKQLATDSYEQRQVTGMKVLNLLKLPRVKKQKGRKMPLSIDELRRIVSVRLDRDGDRIIAIIIRAFTTGLRKWPLLNLEEAWTNRVNATQRIPGWAMKGGEDRWEDDDFEVPLCRWAIEVTPPPPEGSKWNFVNPKSGRPNKQLDRSLYEIARRAGVRRFCLQELRMTFLTLLDAAGVEEPVREILVGHRPRSVSEQAYIRRHPEILRKAVAYFDELREELEGSPGKVVRMVAAAGS